MIGITRSILGSCWTYVGDTVTTYGHPGDTHTRCGQVRAR